MTSREAAHDPHHHPSVCLVVPCFNEGTRLPGEAFAASFAGPNRCAFCFVNDGSTDNTSEVLARLRSLAPELVEVVTLDANRGKAEAVRQGVLHALAWRQFEFVGYWDADLATPLSEIARFVELMRQHPRCEFILGSRVKRLGSYIERRGVRHVTGRMFATMTSVFLDLPCYDSQCGAKLLRSGMAAKLFSDAFVTRWLFDVELLVRLRQLNGSGGLAAAIETPLGEWRDVGGSKLGIASMLKSPLDLLRIRRRYPVQANRTARQKEDD